MSVKGKPLPPARTLIEAVDRAAKQTARRAAQDAVAPAVAANTPRKSGQTVKALKPRVRQTKSGVAVSVGAPRGRKHTPGTATVAEVVRWVTRGTGVHRDGPGPKLPIRSKVEGRRMVLPGGARRWSVKGQKPNPFVARIGHTAGPKVQRAFEQGARDAAAEIAKVIR